MQDITFFRTSIHVNISYLNVENIPKIGIHIGHLWVKSELQQSIGNIVT
jgi:hypothetical protein